jgi:hypothetical protein
MARELVARGACYLPEAETVSALRLAGFGSPSVKSLHRRAADMARAFVLDETGK